MGKGYIIHYWSGEIAVEEVNIFAEFTFEDREHYALQKQHFIWSSVNGQREKPDYKSTSPLVYMLKHPEESDFQYEQIFLTLDEVKEEINRNLSEQIEEAERRLDGSKRILNALKNLDLETLPKDKYTSPFSGEPT